MENGYKTPSDLDEIDGLSSRSSIDEDGKYNFKTQKIDEFQEKFKKKVQEIREEQDRRAAHDSLQPALRKAFLEKFQNGLSVAI